MTPARSTPVSLTRPSSGLRNRFLAAGALSLLAWVLLGRLAPGPSIPWTPTMREAAERTAAAQAVTADHCRAAGIAIDPVQDPGGTCLIGPELTELFTSLGQLAAKRTTLTPDVAALLVHLLAEAGVGGGDTVAIGASGSFPSLLVAGLAAVEAVGAHPVAIVSLGASSYGATRPDFHLLDLYRLLLREGVVATPPVAVSLGGSGDVGEEFGPTFREALIEELDRGPTPFLEEPELEANVARRMGLYCGADASAACAATAFLNIGGGEANLGTDARILSVPPGLNTELASRIEPPPLQERGVLFAMAARGIPVIHLLNLRGLALRYGLPWDPSRPPDPGTTALRDTTRGKGWAFWLLTTGYAAALALVFLWRPGGTAPSNPAPLPDTER